MHGGLDKVPPKRVNSNKLRLIKSCINEGLIVYMSILYHHTYQHAVMVKKGGIKSTAKKNGCTVSKGIIMRNFLIINVQRIYLNVPIRPIHRHFITIRHFN